MADMADNMVALTSSRVSNIGRPFASACPGNHGGVLGMSSAILAAILGDLQKSVEELKKKNIRVSIRFRIGLVECYSIILNGSDCVNIVSYVR